ncbi:MAG: carbohydrate ABC transporter permease [Petrotogales bacterium]
MKKRTKYNLTTLTFLLPWIITFSLFSAFPIIFSLSISFTDYSGLSPEFSFVGFKNFIELFKDDIFLIALRNTTIFVVGTIPFTTTIALLLAVLINSKMVKLKGLFKAGFFLPSVMSMVVIATIWRYMYSADGIINTVLQTFGIEKTTGWLASPDTALTSIMIMNIWAAIGYYTIIFLAGLQSIPEQLYESASIDGASSTKKFFNITLPLIKPTLFFVIAINTIRSFQIFSEIFTMTGGEPLNSTQTIVHYLYIKGFRQFEMGYASAMAYVLVVIIMIVTLIQQRALRSESM